MHLPPLINDLAVILAIAGAMTIICQFLRQPVVIGYILAGVIVGPYTPPFLLVKDVASIQTWAELGVIFLMFNLGLEFSFRKLLSVGVTAGVTAVLEVLFFLVTGYWVGIWLGWTPMESLFLGAMLSISSTTIIIKTLEDLRLKKHRFASMVYGTLIVEDLLAILMLVGLGAIATSGDFSVMSLATASANLFIVVGSWFIAGYFVIPRLMTVIGKKGNNETVTLVSIGLCLVLVAIASSFGYSAALGAFIMGSILAETKIIHRIEGLMTPLRDLFGAIFFVSIGMLIDPKILWEYKGTVALLSVFTIIGKIYITSLGAMVSGQNFKNSMQMGMSLAQIGEFSFIIANLGLALNAISTKLYPIAVAVSLITSFCTPYLIKYSAATSGKLESWLPKNIQSLFARYASWCEHKKATAHKFEGAVALLSRWAINGIVVTFIFNLTYKYVDPIALSFIPEKWHQLTVWLLAFTLSAPFIWGMVFTSRLNYLSIRQERSLFKALIVLALPILTAAWIDILTAKHYTTQYILPATFVFLTLIYLALYRKVENYYHWLESAFLASFQKPQEDDEEGKVPKSLSTLAPWDSHLVNVEIHPNAQAVGQSLMAANLRQRFGINIVAIRRGLQTNVAPMPSDMILPGDTLVILGTDDQIERARPELEIPANISTMMPTNLNYRLRHLRVLPNSPLVGVSIRQSGIREKYLAMVVGVERGENRIINPDTDLQIHMNDILWVVGEQNMLQQLEQSIQV